MIGETIIRGQDGAEPRTPAHDHRRGAWRHRGTRSRVRPRRPAHHDPHREHAPRGLRVPHRPPAGDHARGGREEARAVRGSRRGGGLRVQRLRRRAPREPKGRDARPLHQRQGHDHDQVQHAAAPSASATPSSPPPEAPPPSSTPSSTDTTSTRAKSRRANGSLIAFETGQSTSYALFSAQERGQMFGKPGVDVRGRWSSASTSVRGDRQGATQPSARRRPIRRQGRSDRRPQRAQNAHAGRLRGVHRARARGGQTRADQDPKNAKMEPAHEADGQQEEVKRRARAAKKRIPSPRASRKRFRPDARFATGIVGHDLHHRVRREGGASARARAGARTTPRETGVRTSEGTTSIWTISSRAEYYYFPGLVRASFSASSERLTDSLGPRAPRRGTQQVRVRSRPRPRRRPPRPRPPPRFRLSNGGNEKTSRGLFRRRRPPTPRRANGRGPPGILLRDVSPLGSPRPEGGHHPPQNPQWPSRRDFSSGALPRALREGPIFGSVRAPEKPRPPRISPCPVVSRLLSDGKRTRAVVLRVVVAVHERLERAAQLRLRVALGVGALRDGGVQDEDARRTRPRARPELNHPRREVVSRSLTRSLSRSLSRRKRPGREHDELRGDAVRPVALFVFVFVPGVTGPSTIHVARDTYRVGGEAVPSGRSAGARVRGPTDRVRLRVGVDRERSAPR